MELFFEILFTIIKSFIFVSIWLFVFHSDTFREILDDIADFIYEKLSRCKK